MSNRDLPKRRRATRAPVVRPEDRGDLWEAVQKAAEGVWPVELLQRQLADPAFPHMILVAWIDLPGDNSQRAVGFRRNGAWKDQLKTDFARCFELQRRTFAALPLRQPRVHIVGYVGGASDLANLGGRYKKVQDILQPSRTYERVNKRNGKKTVVQSGLLGLIENDRLLMPTYKEIAVRARDGYGRTQRKVVLFIWDETKPEGDEA